MTPSCSASRPWQRSSTSSRPSHLRGDARRVLHHRHCGRVGRHRSWHVSQAPHPAPRPVFEKFYFRPSNLGFPVFDTSVGKIGVHIRYDRHFPEGWREVGLNAAQIEFNPNASQDGVEQQVMGARGARSGRREPALRARAQSRRFGEQRVGRTRRGLLRHVKRG